WTCCGLWDAPGCRRRRRHRGHREKTHREESNSCLLCVSFLCAFCASVVRFSLLREEGVEPSRLAAQDPKSCASANSATRALKSILFQTPPRLLSHCRVSRAPAPYRRDGPPTLAAAGMCERLHSGLHR